MSTNKRAGADRFSRALLSAVLAGGVVAYSSAAAANEQAKASEPQTKNAQAQAPADKQRATGGEEDKKNNPDLSQVDQNNDRTLAWSEINAIYDSELEEAGWNEGYVFENYDDNDDQLLGDDEYMQFVAALIEETTAQAKPPSDDLDVTAGMDAEDNELADNVNTRTQQMRLNELSAAEGEDSNAMERATQGQTSQQFDQKAKKGEKVDVSDLSTAEIEDRTVVNADGEELGQVEQVITAPDGSISGVVVGIGGFWRIGNKDIFVPVDQVEKNSDRIVWDTELSEQELTKMPQYKTQEYSTVIPEE